MLRQAAACVLALTVQASAQPGFSEQTLQDYLHKTLGSDAVQYRFARAQLSAGQPEAVLVYITSPDYCGSGGCRLMVLAPRGHAFAILGDMTITRPPIRVLDHTTHGWHDVAVSVSGGGIIHGYEVVLPFDGRHYASNPTLPPAHRAPASAPGRTVLDR